MLNISDKVLATNPNPTSFTLVKDPRGSGGWKFKTFKVLIIAVMLVLVKC